MEHRVSIYFPIYKRIEQEVLKLSSAIFFSDDQLMVYSLDIADLLVRCVVEIESIAKDIYRIEEKKEPEKTSICFNWMEEHWKIDQKDVFINSPYVSFEKLKVFEPFKYKNKSAEDYYSIYNAIKHDRAKNLKKATVYSLIRALGALYILNIYLINKRIMLKDDDYAENLDRTFGSQIFEINVAPCKDIPVLSSQININSEKCVYRVVREESDYAFKIIYKNQFEEIKSTTVVMKDDCFQKYAKRWENIH